MDSPSFLLIPEDYLCDSCSSRDGQWIHDKAGNGVGILCQKCGARTETCLSWRDGLRDLMARKFAQMGEYKKWVDELMNSKMAWVFSFNPLFDTWMVEDISHHRKGRLNKDCTISWEPFIICERCKHDFEPIKNSDLMEDSGKPQFSCPRCGNKDLENIAHHGEEDLFFCSNCYTAWWIIQYHSDFKILRSYRGSPQDERR